MPPDAHRPPAARSPDDGTPDDQTLNDRTADDRTPAAWNPGGRALNDWTLAAAIDAARYDAETGFPRAALHALHALGAGAPDVDDAAIGLLLRRLAAVGRGDLSVGRIWEGHVNVLVLVRRFGGADLKARVEATARGGALFGVWNTDDPADPLRLEGDRLVGRKTFATGIDGLSNAVVTTETADGRAMWLVPLDGLPVDRTWWRPMGMRASGSHVVDFTGLRVGEAMRLGAPGDYVSPPWFSAGAIRFAAVQLGGAHGVLDLALAHLRKTGRGADPYQRQRLAEMGVAIEGGYGWLDRAGRAWREAAEADAAGGAGDGDAARSLTAVVNAARSAIERAALDVLERAERGVGAAGMIAPHPLERRIRDLRVYLRQPNPDGALAAAGQALLDGDWRPGEDGPCGIQP